MRGTAFVRLRCTLLIARSPPRSAAARYELAAAAGSGATCAAKSAGDCLSERSMESAPPSMSERSRSHALSRAPHRRPRLCA